MDKQAVAGGTMAVTGDAGDVGTVVVGGNVAVTDGVGAMTGGDVGTTTACSHRDGWCVKRPGGSVPGGGGARAGGWQDQMERGGLGGVERVCTATDGASAA